VAFKSTFRYINDVSTIDNNEFHTYVDSICPNELEIKNTTACSTSALYFDMLLKVDTKIKLKTQLYNKRDAFHFSIINFISYATIFPIPSAYGFMICSWLDMQDLVRHTIRLYFEVVCRQKLISRRFLPPRLQAAFHKTYDRYKDLVCQCNLPVDLILSDVFHINR
jgi:hypothetical protein